MKQFKISEEEKKRILNLHESRTKNNYLFEQPKDPILYSVNKTPEGKFRILVKTATTGFKDAESVFGKGSNWKDYDNREEAQKIVDGLNKKNEPKNIYTK